VTVIGPLLNGTPTSPVLVPEQVIDIGGATVTEQLIVPLLPWESVIVTV
jgi:hypothetical protein